MMNDINSIAGLPPTWEQQQAEASQAGVEEFGQQTFLNLLTTQLQNQDPLDPMKNEDFIAQLAQFSSLEELMGISSALDSVYTGIAAMNNATMANLLGTEVVAMGNEFSYDGEGPVTLQFDAAAELEGGTVTITNESGSVVWSGALPAQNAGEGSFEWDGTDMDGQPVPEGRYTFSITGSGADGESVEVTELIIGLVDEMDYSTGVPLPSVDGTAVSLGDILRLTAGSE